MLFRLIINNKRETILIYRFPFFAINSNIKTNIKLWNCYNINDILLYYTENTILFLK
jgi:hypothetical protein